MMLPSLLAFVACFFIGVQASNQTLEERANAYIDEFIEKATNDTGGFIDPLPLEDIEKKFVKEIGFVRVKGEAKLYDGKIFGLSSIQRKGNAVIIDLDDVYIISTMLTFKKINATYRGSVKLNDLGPTFTLKAKVGSSRVSMFFTVPAEGGKASLMSLNLNKLQDIRVSISGLGAMGWTAGMISTLALNALEKPVAKAASIKLFEHFSKEIEKVPFPGDSAEF